MADLTGPTGSLINNLYANSKYPAPVVGMGATRLSYTDREPYTIVAVVSPTKILVNRDEYKRVDTNGMSECQEYEYTPNLATDGADVVTLRKNGRWVMFGESMKGGTSFAIGAREKYHDFSH